MLFNRLKSKYTQEEQKLLLEMLAIAHKIDVQNRIEKGLAPYIGHPTQTAAAPILTILESFDARLDAERFWDFISSEIIEIPIDQVPLYINDSDILTRTTAIWRLKIGK